jgi:hypothetical protein
VTLRLRQIALAANDLERAMADASAVFDLAPPFHDPGVEVFGPSQRGIRARRHVSRNRVSCS